MKKYTSEICVNDRRVIISGWVHTIRILKNISFILLRDRDGLVQITLIKDNVAPELYNKVLKLQRESVIMVEGVVKSNTQVKRGFEILPTDIKVLSTADVPLPLGVADRVGVDFDTRLNNRFLDLRKPEVEAIFFTKHLFVKGIREYLDDKGFIEVHTPKIVQAGAEGGATLFEITYFDRKAYLAQSPQLYKQMLMATGFDKVYEIAPAFRAEPSDTPRHTAEFTSFDSEIAFIRTQDDVLKLLESVVVHAMDYVYRKGSSYIEHLGITPKIPTLPAPRLKYTDVLTMLDSAGKHVRFGEDIDTDSEKLLGQLMVEKGYDLYYIVEYPSSIKPFYIMVDDDISYSFDLDYKGMEIASGGQREHRYDRLVERMRAMNLNVKNFESYLNAFKYGMPPHGGFGFGIERFLQKFLNLQNIRETILFPRDRYRLVP
jgi:aspartyl-tRNA synthetase